MFTKYLFAGAAAVALAACSGGENDATSQDVVTDTETVGTDTAAMAPAGDTAAMPSTGQEFVTMVAASDMYEMEAGKLAQQMGTAQEVKDFGAMMVKDHTANSNNLKTAAGQAQGVTVNPQLTPKQQSDLDALRNAGTNFDTTYKQQQVASHEMTLNVLRHFAQNGDNQALKDYAAKATPIVEGHLNQARNLPAGQAQ